jgi:hypothetical protein
MQVSVGAFEFRNLRPGLYELRVVAPGFVAYEEKGIAVQAQRATVRDVQLSVELEEQQVTIDDRTISTDADNNANAVVLRGRDLEALPNDPNALAAALQALAVLLIRKEELKSKLMDSLTVRYHRKKPSEKSGSITIPCS